ncbi:hypothetical protein PoB_003395900 [Plakobranchus ocellatus]|uniref:Uncharacterized protein n=1 Tax=Plakobranchus ocellatus TaxID=259542 RepID=A0AAV4AMP0_9GAST|nr:hypothetical protein PoB_003395900 [Plakobranchus ocellatus]
MHGIVSVGSACDLCQNCRSDGLSLLVFSSLPPSVSHTNRLPASEQLSESLRRRPAAGRKGKRIGATTELAQRWGILAHFSSPSEPALFSSANSFLAYRKLLHHADYRDKTK